MLVLLTKNTKEPPPLCESHFSLRDGEIVLLGIWEPSDPVGLPVGSFDPLPPHGGSSSLEIIIKIWKQDNNEIIRKHLT